MPRRCQVYFYYDLADDRFPVPCAEGDLELPALLSSAWELKNGKRIFLLVNPSAQALSCRVKGKEVLLPPMDALVLPMEA